MTTRERMKQGLAFCFVEGTLYLKKSGYGEADGWGRLQFDEKQVDFIPYDDKEGCCLQVDIAPSELRELRDFLIRELGP